MSNPTSNIGVSGVIDASRLRNAAKELRTRTWRPKPDVANNIKNTVGLKKRSVNLNSIIYESKNITSLYSISYYIPKITAVGFDAKEIALVDKFITTIRDKNSIGGNELR